MVDTVQNLAGTTSTVVVPETNSAPQVSSSGTASLEVGANTPPAPVTESNTSGVSVDVSSAMSNVLSAMKDMPPPIDLEAVQRLRAEIEANDYPVDVDKISEALVSSLNEIG